MVLADSNIWLALVLSKHHFHEVCRSWIANIKSSERIIFCRATQQSFLRLLTTRSVFAPYGIPPFDNQSAWETYQDLLAQPSIKWVSEPQGLDAHWKRLTARPLASPKLWMDAYLAAFAMARRDRLLTTDLAFGQFPGLDVVILEMK